MLTNPFSNFASPSEICNEIFGSSSIPNPTINNPITTEEISRIKDLKIFSDFGEFIAKLIYFRKGLYEFINLCLVQDDSREYQEFEKPCFYVKNEDYKSLLPLYSENKTKVKNLALFIYLCIDFARRNESYFKVLKQRGSLGSKILNLKKNLSELDDQLENKKLSRSDRLILKQEIQKKRNVLSDFEAKKNEMHKISYYQTVYHYCNFIVEQDQKFKGFSSLLVSLFSSFVKVIDFYDQRLKDIVGDHLNELRCPGTYTNRNILTLQNSSRPNTGNQGFYIDENSFSFIILDWIFYFFSPDFQEQLASGTIDRSKLLARLTALLFILFSDSDKSKLLFSQKKYFDDWMINLEFKFEMECVFQLESPDFFKEVFNKIKHFNESFNLNGFHLRNKAARGRKLDFLNDLEAILKDYFIQLYEKGLYECSRYLSNRV